MLYKSSAKAVLLFKILCCTVFIVSVVLLFLCPSYDLAWLIIMLIAFFVFFLLTFVWYRFYTLPNGRNLTVKGSFGKIMIFYDGHMIDRVGEDIWGFSSTDKFVNFKLKDGGIGNIRICRRTVTVKVNDKIIGNDSMWG